MLKLASKGSADGVMVTSLGSYTINLGSRAGPGGLKLTLGGPAVSVMAMSLDSHVVDRGSCPGPSDLELRPVACAYVPKILRGEWRRRDYSVAIPHGG